MSTCRHVCEAVLILVASLLPYAPIIPRPINAQLLVLWAEFLEAESTKCLADIAIAQGGRLWQNPFCFILYLIHICNRYNLIPHLSIPRGLPQTIPCLERQKCHGYQRHCQNPWEVSIASSSTKLWMSATHVWFISSAVPI